MKIATRRTYWSTSDRYWRLDGLLHRSDRDAQGRLLPACETGFGLNCDTYYLDGVEVTRRGVPVALRRLSYWQR